jgi:hypothetical protein
MTAADRRGERRFRAYEGEPLASWRRSAGAVRQRGAAASRVGAGVSATQPRTVGSAGGAWFRAARAGPTGSGFLPPPRRSVVPFSAHGSPTPFTAGIRLVPPVPEGAGCDDGPVEVDQTHSVGRQVGHGRHAVARGAARLLLFPAQRAGFLTTRQTSLDASDHSVAPPTGLSTLRLDPGRFPPTPAACYRAPGQLPGPDLPRLISTSNSGHTQARLLRLPQLPQVASIATASWPMAVTLAP